MMRSCSKKRFEDPFSYRFQAVFLLPKIMDNFSELSVSATLKDNLTRAKFTALTPIQAGAIPPALEGKDVLGTAQTGTGKTLAFLIPILNCLMRAQGRGVQALVLVPTRELAMQVYDTFLHIGRATGIRAALVVGGLAESRQLMDIRGGARLVIATPGRLEDYIKRKLVIMSGVQILVLDEADRMVDMGFLPQMKTILRDLPKERQTMCFSATLDRSVAHLVQEYLKNPVRISIGSETNAPASVQLQAYVVSHDQKFPLLCHLLTTQTGTFLIFARTKHGADKLAHRLVQSGFSAGAIHGGRTQSQRTRALQGFKNKMPRVLVATDVAARGIHVTGIAHVVNYDMPQVPDDFIHRVGRTGRAEASGVASSFVTAEDISMMHIIERRLGRKVERMPIPADLPRDVRPMSQPVQRRFTPRSPSVYSSRSGSTPTRSYHAPSSSPRGPVGGGARRSPSGAFSNRARSARPYRERY